MLLIQLCFVADDCLSLAAVPQVCLFLNVWFKSVLCFVLFVSCLFDCVVLVFTCCLAGFSPRDVFLCVCPRCVLCCVLFVFGWLFPYVACFACLVFKVLLFSVVCLCFAVHVLFFVCVL